MLWKKLIGNLFLITLMFIFSCQNIEKNKCVYKFQSKVLVYNRTYDIDSCLKQSFVKYTSTNKEESFRYKLSMKKDSIILFFNGEFDCNAIYYDSKSFHLGSKNLLVKRYLADYEYENLQLYYVEGAGIVLFTDGFSFNRELISSTNTSIDLVQLISSVKKDTLFYKSPVRTIKLY